ncbi:hypothetical protein PHYSODRAFT_343401 [Phytophthora sojae]|uniref:Uncharacterized protein n=1 Tax=Phytophthora sojae (strain P6497) TaxID=1094619 RepID=G5AJJ4_PHYSP|nr:hypothetical protein PHYSODRAFT_343401 [Phytophthora sojae]EGZ04308.1 hypothetical protein PHYSODRAFT_343401 [Phytophthora sojae]|eukprot:XP_009540245.1 hypothetical protein PHYSODRAFT_343401 [Phytophthora sojae]
MSDADCNAGQASDGHGDRGATSSHADTQDARQASPDRHQGDANAPDDPATKLKALVVKVADADAPRHDNGNVDAVGSKGDGDTEGKAKGTAGSVVTAVGKMGAFAGTSCTCRSASGERLPDRGKGVFGHAPQVPLHVNFRTKMEPLSSPAAKYEFQGRLSLQDSRSRAAQASHPELAGQPPPARFAICSDLNLTFVRVPARIFDCYEECFLRDGFGASRRSGPWKVSQTGAD